MSEIKKLKQGTQEKAPETMAQRVAGRNESRVGGKWRGGQETGRLLCRPDMNSMVIINQRWGAAN